ncbi:MAG: glycosyltransferase family 39 protein [Spirochaetes bacterium]|nr:glycosyltransferase family 39 protein [Spirochaetota bacterium]
MKSPFFNGHIIDVRFHQKWAEDIINGDIFSLKQGDALYKAPLYPYFLAFCFRIFGQNFFIIRLIQIILGSLTSVLLYLICKKYLNKWLALISTLLYSFYFVTVYFDNALEIPVLSNFLTVLSFYFLIKGNKVKNFVFSGLSLGLSITALPSNILLLPLYIIIIYFHNRKNLKFILLVLISCAIVILPVTIRNYVGSGRFVLICANKGVNLYLGNNKNFEETMTIKPGLEWSRFVYKNFSEDEIIQKDYERDRAFSSRVDSDDYWNKKVYRFIKKHPDKFIINTIKKIFMYFGRYEIMRNEDVYHQWNYSMLKYFPFLDLTILFPLCLTGAIFFFKKIRKRWDIYFFLFLIIVPNLIFFVTTRYRYFSLSIWSIFASYAIFYFSCQIKAKKIFNVFIFILIFTSAFFLVNLNFFVIKNNPALKYIYTGNAYHNSAKYKKAIEYYDKALSYCINTKNSKEVYIKAELFYHKSNSLLSEGYDDKALIEIENAITILPDYGDALFIKSLILFLKKNYTDAAAFILSTPKGATYTDYNNFLNTLLLLESTLKASKINGKKLEEFNNMTEYSLFQSRLIYYQGTNLLKQGKNDQAKKLFEKAINLDENNLSAKKHLNIFNTLD